MDNSLLAMIASGGQPTTPPPDAASLFETAYKLKAMKQDQQEQNALKAFLSNPENLGPDDLPTDNALKKLMTVAPKSAFELVGQDAKIRNERALGEEHAQKAALDTDNYVQKGVREPAMNAYDEALKAGKSPEAAQAIAQRAYDEGLKELTQSGVFSKDQIAQFDPSFDPDRVRARSKINEMKNADKWQVLSDPSTGEQYRYNPSTAQATTLDGKPYDPKGAERLGGASDRGGLDQAGIDYYAKLFRTQGPSALGRLQKADRDKVINAAAGSAGGDATDDIKTQFAGKGAQAEQRSAGTRTGQLRIAEEEMEGAVDLSSRAYQKLPRGSFVPFNQLANLVEKKTSSPEQAAAYAADNAIVNIYARMISPTGQGTDSDKNHAREMLNQAQGPEAHQAVLNQLMAEGKNALDKAQKARAAITEETPVAKDKPKGGGEMAHPRSRAEYEALPSGAHYSKPGDPPGTYRVKP